MLWFTSAYIQATKHSFRSIAQRSVTAVSMVQFKGLETRTEGATPTEGGMTLYLKAGPDGISVGDCPFAHYVRIVLEEKGLEYDLKPSTKPPLKPKNKEALEAAEEAVSGLFPSIAKYLKHTPDGDSDDSAKKADLEFSLAKLENHLSQTNGPYLTGSSMALVDCSLSPKLYHMQTGLEAFKSNAIDISSQFPAISSYMETVFARPSFQGTLYPKDVVVWGWGNARK
ncbi:hypothetical protein ACA910_005113 [Epithemia clementina (nom. ined.)]